MSAADEMARLGRWVATGARPPYPAGDVPGCVAEICEDLHAQLTELREAKAAATLRPTVFAVVNSSYADDEVHALYKTRELAEEDARRKGGMWTVAEWTVNNESLARS